MSTSQPSPAITIRRAQPEDAPGCARICFDAFYKINADHNFPPEMPERSMPEGLLSMMFAPWVLRRRRRKQRSYRGRQLPRRALDYFRRRPHHYRPAVQNSGIGRQLMQAVLDRAVERGAPGVRLLQSAFHNRSLSLHTELGFDPREPISVMIGPGFASPSKAAKSAPRNPLTSLPVTANA